MVGKRGIEVCEMLLALAEGGRAFVLDTPPISIAKTAARIMAATYWHAAVQKGSTRPTASIYVSLSVLQGTDAASCSGRVLKQRDQYEALWHTAVYWNSSAQCSSEDKVYRESIAWHIRSIGLPCDLQCLAVCAAVIQLWGI